VGAAIAATGFSFALTGAFACAAFTSTAGVFALVADALTDALAAAGFADAAVLAAVFLTLLATGLLTGFLAAVATIDSSVGDTALKN
jgi:hypothetical protein